MSVISLKTRQKYGSLLAGNEYYIPPSFESIASATPSGVTSTTFSSIPGTYQHLQLRGSIVNTVTGWDPTIEFNGSNGTYSHYLSGSGTAVTAGATSGFMYIYRPGFMDRNQPFVFIVDIFDYASTTKNKTLGAFAGQDVNGAGSHITLTSGFRNNTSAITSLTFNLGSNYSGTIALYGIKGA